MGKGRKGGALLRGAHQQSAAAFATVARSGDVETQTLRGRARRRALCPFARYHVNFPVSETVLTERCPSPTIHL
jgi:hypothetical protein